MEKQYNSIIIGHGKFGSQATTVIRKYKQFRIKYIVDPQPINLKNKRLITDLQTALSDKEVELVFIFSPTQTHASIIRMALQANKHIFCVAPLTENAQELTELYRVANKTKRALISYYPQYSLPSWEVIRLLLPDITYIEYIDTTSTILEAAHTLISTLFTLYRTKININDVRCHPNGLVKVHLTVGNTRIEATLGQAHPHWVERRCLMLGMGKLIKFDDYIITINNEACERIGSYQREKDCLDTELDCFLGGDCPNKDTMLISEIVEHILKRP
jgi:hypothetical protein